jgi:hypothetical protein
MFGACVELGLFRQVEILIYPPTLFWITQFDKNAKLLQTLQCKKSHQGANPGGHSFVFLNVSINKKPFFFW